MKIILLHHSVVGGTRDLANRFKYPSKNYLNYRGEADRIVLVGRHIYKFDDSDKLEKFIRYHRKKIVGVIISDDKNYGYFFGDAREFYEGLGVKVLAIWDKIITDEQIKELEGRLDEQF